MAVMIGVDPHKGSHTAVAIDEGEQVLAELRVRSGPTQLKRLLEWAQAFSSRAWAIENATGLGYLLAQQLVAAGETVYDVQPKLAARVRLLDTESTNKNDPHDARSVAIAALRSTKRSPVRAEDHSAVAKLWSKRRRDLARLRNKVACRLHNLLCDLVAGGVPDEMSTAKAAKLLGSVEVSSAVQAARVELGHELLDDLGRLDIQLKELKERLAQVVAASGTSTVTVYGVGPVVAAAVIGLTGDINRFPSRHHFASFNGTAPIDVSSGPKKIHRLSLRGSRQLNHAIHLAAIVQIRFHTSPGRAYYDRKLGEGKSHKEALRCLKRRISDALYACMVADAKRAQTGDETGPGGHTGNDSSSSAAGSHPAAPALRTSHSRTRRHATPRRQPTPTKKVASRERRPRATAPNGKKVRKAS